jgi:beta-barrel assembly-enhancing protease
MSYKNRTIPMILILVLALLLPALAADRTILNPGRNRFSTQDDVELGRQMSEQVENTLPMFSDRNAEEYIDSLGRRLASSAPGEPFSYTFKIADDRSINAYSLPGGYIYVTRGAVEAAQNEAQLAGVLAHAIGHVAMRHGTAQLAKDYEARFPGSTRRSSINTVMSQLGVSFSPDSNLLKYSREAERQADIVGTQILYDAGFDPRQMVQFFQRLQTVSSQKTQDLTTSHPAPANRNQTVQREIQKMGGVRPTYRADSRDFRDTKATMAAAAPTTDRRGSTASNFPDLPSSRLIPYYGQDMQFRYPENWRVQDDGMSLTLAPSGGVLSGSLAFGMSISTFEPERIRSFGPSFSPLPGNQRNQTSLDDANTQLLDHLRQSNPNMRVISSNSRTRVDGMAAVVTELENDSPIGGTEVDRVVAVMVPDGLIYYFIGVAPEREFDQYVQAFDDVIASVRFNDSRRRTN